jgi:hypothetical protein
MAQRTKSFCGAFFKKRLLSFCAAGKTWDLLV